MNIININSKYDLTAQQISFAKSILCSYRYNYRDRRSLYYLSKRIPFYLVDRAAFESIKIGNYKTDNERWEKERFDDRDERHDDRQNDNYENRENREYQDRKPDRPITELLGFYTSKGAHGIPEIYLCTETILNHTNNDEELTYLLAKVITHELAHAYMDRHDYGAKDEFYQWMEESFANEITLEHFEEFEHYPNRYYKHRKLQHHSTNSAYKYAQDFVLSQPDNYKLGYYLNKFHIHDYVWWGSRKNKVKLKSKAKAEWLHYVQSNIHSGNYDKETLDKLTRNVLLEDPYNEMPKDER